MNGTIKCVARGAFPALALLLGAIILTTSSVAAEEATGGTPGDWLANFWSARSLGLGGAHVAAADEPLGIVWNPATLTRLDQNELHFETAHLFAGTSINSFSLAVPSSRFPSVGLTVLSLSSPDIERTTELNESQGTFQEGDVAFLLSASRQITRRVGVGTNLKVLRQSVAEFGATGVGGDIGVIYEVNPMLRLGASILNIGGPSLTLRETSETYPRDFRLGAAVRILEGRGLISTELDQRSGPGGRFRGGGEFWVHDKLALRAGYNNDRPSGGFSVCVTPTMQIDYGLSDHDLGITHRIGFSYRFGGFAARSEANPPVFSPLGQPSVTRFLLRSKTKAETEHWTLRIVDKLGTTVREFGGSGKPPAHVMWDGKDEAGLPVADGTYMHQLEVVDHDGRVITGEEQSVEITTQGPQGAVPVIVR